MLEMMCKNILEKNYQLYLKHENMLDEERKKRKELADGFQGRMAEVTQEIQDLKEERQTEFAANQEIREKIQEEVARYKAHEENYQKSMNVHRKEMEGIESLFKGQLDEKVGSVIKKAEAEKTVYDKHVANCKDLSD